MVIGRGARAGDGGTVYVIFGTKQPFPDPLPLNTLNGSNGFALVGAYDLQAFGYSLAAADVNGDNIPDIIVGGRLYNSNGAAYVIFGQKCGGTWSTACSASYTMNHAFFNGTNGVEFNGPANGEVFNGATVAAGDFNGDNIADIAIGMPSSPAGGSTFVVFGQKCGGLSSGFTACTITQPITLNTAVTGAANNGSGLIRLTLSNTAPYAGTQGMATGNQVLVSGVVGTTEANGTWTVTVVDATHIDLQGSAFSHAYVSGGTASAVINGINGVEYDGPAASYYQFGSMPLAIGDVNGDNIGDLLIGASYAPGTTPPPGALYVIFGQKCGSSYAACTTPVTINSSLLNGTTGVEFDGVAAGNALVYFPTALRIADVNGDNIGDIITTDTGTGGGPGVTIVIYGRSSGWPATAQQLTIGSSNYINGTNGFSFNARGSPYWGSFAVATGDANKDGKSDFVITGLQGNSWAGNGLLVFGQSAAWPSSTTLNAAFFNGVNGVEFDGAAANTYAGWSSVVGDINDDSIPDVIIAAPYSSPNGVTNAGSVYVYYGRKKNWPTSAYNLGKLCTGSGC